MSSTAEARIMRQVATLLVALCAGGATVQAVATRRDRRAFPPPGRLVDVGGHRLHLQVLGDHRGRATVLLEAGMGSFSPNWYWVQQELAGRTRVVSYDRAGLGWSERGPRPRDAKRIAAELHTALERAGIPAPYLLVGHSFGGLPVRAFADRYRDEVVGVVLADASHPDQWARWSTPHADRLLALSQRVTAVLAWVGLLRAIDLSASISRGLPPEQVAQLRALTALPRVSSTVADQVLAWRTSSRAQINGTRTLDPLPLSVLSVSEQPRGADTLTALQAELPELSSNSVHQVIQGATHESLVAQPEYAKVVAAAVCRVLESAQTGQPVAAV